MIGLEEQSCVILRSTENLYADVKVIFVQNIEKDFLR